MLEVFPHLEVEVFPLGKTTGTSGTSGAFFRRKKFAKLPAELHYVEILRCAEFVSSRRADCSTELSKLRISEEASHDVYAVRQPSCSPELAKLWRKGRNNLSLVSDHRIKLIISHKVYLYLPSKWMWTARNVYLRVIISLLNTEFSTNVFACEQASRLGEPNFFLFVRNGNSFTYIL